MQTHKATIDGVVFRPDNWIGDDTDDSGWGVLVRSEDADDRGNWWWELRFSTETHVECDNATAARYHAAFRGPYPRMENAMKAGLLFAREHPLAKKEKELAHAG